MRVCVFHIYIYVCVCAAKVPAGSAALPTMIRTREGKWRVANPLEEYNRCV